MVTKKITLNELRSIVKQIIKEEVEPAYGVSKNLNNYITIPHMLKKSEVISLFVDYTNKFNDIEKFAKHFGYPLDSAEYIIKKGEELYNQEKYNK